MDELTAWLSIARTCSLHAGHLKPLLDRFGSPVALVSASREVLVAAGLSPTTADKLKGIRASTLDSDLRWTENSGHFVVPWGDEQYPPLLSQISDAPALLYVRGDVRCLARAQLAIVGSRNPTPSGRSTAESFAKQLGSCGLAITSGLATGIDAASHRGALAGGVPTIAVCATGLDVVYPRSSAGLAREIESQGALISEFPPGTPPHKRYFPQRNRIISGLSLGTLVVEAAIHSGSLITARLATEQGREVFAIPGPIHNPLARGCHQLIRQGAKLVECAADILSELGPLAATLAPMKAEATDGSEVFAGALDNGYKILLDACGFEPVSVDLLVERTGLGAHEVASMLLILELEGHIDSFPGGLYVRSQPEATK